MPDIKFGAVWYAVAPTKFYRAATFYADTRSGREWYVVFNWGAGTADRDTVWISGQMKVIPAPSMGDAEDMCREKIGSKTRKGYRDENPFHHRVVPPDNHVPDSILTKVPVLVSRVVDTAKAKTAPAPKVSITMGEGQLKPALANRTKWRAQE